MTITLPSKRVAIVDAPEVENFSAKFVYNFFTPDEELNDSGTTPPDFIEKRPAGKFDQEFLNSRNFLGRTPRLVRFEWKCNPAGNRPDIANRVSILENLSKIHNEETFIEQNYTNIFFQDTERKDKLTYFIRRAIEEARLDAEKRTSGRAMSPLDMVKYLYKNTTENVRGDFLAEYFVRLTRNGIRYLDASNEDKITQTVLKRAKGIKTRAQLNNKLLHSLLLTAQQNPINIFDNEAKVLLPEAKRIQENAVAKSSSDVLSADEYDFEIVDIVDYRVIDPNTFDSTVQVVGYIIDKVEYTDSGVVAREPIIVESPNASSTADLKVRYGATYGYSARTIVYVEVAAQDEDTNELIAIGFLISSKKSPSIVVQCIEEVAPPWVADFNVEWDYMKDVPRVSWSFPVNPQRDIKYFQVFKRNSISEPFTLVKMYDFNDSLTPRPLMETPDPVLVEKLTGPKAFYLDFDFKKDQKAIYAVATVDAHGYTSNYSMQLEIGFDRFKNKITKKLISVGGAPKPYPNFFLQQDAFVDSIRTSGAKKIKVVFNPEYLKVFDRDRNDLRFLKTDGNSKYRLQLLNVDLQAQQNFDILLQDRRRRRD
jgi:hypothetical protein